LSGCCHGVVRVLSGCCQVVDCCQVVAMVCFIVHITTDKSILAMATKHSWDIRNVEQNITRRFPKLPPLPLQGKRCGARSRVSWVCNRALLPATVGSLQPPPASTFSSCPFTGPSRPSGTSWDMPLTQGPASNSARPFKLLPKCDAFLWFCLVGPVRSGFVIVCAGTFYARIVHISVSMMIWWKVIK